MANTPFLDLVKPAGTDRALVSVINSNSDKIDGGVSTLSEQITNVQNRENVNMVSLVDSWLKTAKDGVYRVSGSSGSRTGTFLEDADLNYGILIVQRCPLTSPSIDLFGSITFRTTSGNVYVRDFMIAAATGELSWDTDLRIVSAISMAKNVESNASITFTPAKTVSLLVGVYAGHSFMYIVFRASSTNVSVSAVKEHSSVSVTVSAGVITVANSYSSTFRVRLVDLA